MLKRKIQFLDVCDYIPDGGIENLFISDEIMYPNKKKLEDIDTIREHLLECPYCMEKYGKRFLDLIPNEAEEIDNLKKINNQNNGKVKIWKAIWLLFSKKWLKIIH